MFVAAGSRDEPWRSTSAAPATGEKRLTQFNKGWHVTVQVALSNPLRSSSRSIRAGYRCSLAALLLFGCETLQTAKAAGETRTISFHHTHTKENLTVTYKVNGRYDEEALKKINHCPARLARGTSRSRWTRDLIDLLWEVHRETGSREPIWVVCGYRSPKTNSMLRKPFARRRPAQPAHAGQGDRLLHSGRFDRRTARRRPARPARRRRLLSLVGTPFVHSTPAACATGRGCRRRSSRKCWRRDNSPVPQCVGRRLGQARERWRRSRAATAERCRRS